MDIMTTATEWNRRIEMAIAAGGFTPEDRERADSWDTDPIEELSRLMGVTYELVPRDIRGPHPRIPTDPVLFGIGQEFAVRVATDDTFTTQILMEAAFNFLKGDRVTGEAIYNAALRGEDIQYGIS